MKCPTWAKGDPRMHFLLTNDDGVHAIGLKALSCAVLEKGHTLTVCAPQTQQSATSHHITLHDPLMVNEVPWEGGKAYAVAGSPADCARLGVLLSDQPIDFVFSGINNGENAGTAIYYSGTVSAAREASMLNQKAMAVSIMVGATWDMLLNLARKAVELAEKFAYIDLPRLTVINLNAPAVPANEIKPLRIAPLSDAFYLDSYEKRTNTFGKTYFWLKAGVKTEPHKEGTDMDLLFKKHMTLSLVGPYTVDNAWLNVNLQDFLQ